MAKITAHRCDGCNSLVEDTRELYQLPPLRGLTRYLDPSGNNNHQYAEITLEFCRGCARRLLATLERLATAKAPARKRRPS